MKVFIELWKAKEAWKGLPPADREAYAAQLGPVIQDFVDKGAVLEAWGMNTDETQYRADYDFFAVTKFPSEALLKEFQAIVESAGWYAYFDQVNLSGSLMSPQEVVGKIIEL
ncbi:DUF6616 family protein [Robiginitalea sp.]|uniref:DUF6616 family protein n=1 Tax=Robiginitalea sp. TaxID=1902411 RepID=UPI003C70E9C1